MIEAIRETTLTVNGLGAIIIMFGLVMGGIDLTIKVAQYGIKSGNKIYRIINAEKIAKNRKERLLGIAQKG